MIFDSDSHLPLSCFFVCKKTYIYLLGQMQSVFLFDNGEHLFSKLILFYYDENPHHSFYQVVAPMYEYEKRCVSPQTPTKD